MTSIVKDMRTNAFDLKNRVVVITGGAGLLGKVFSRAVALQGGRPIVADIRIEAAKNVACQINNELGSERVFALEIDITSKRSLQMATQELQAKFGQIDALVNNAYPRNKNYGRKFEDVEYADFCENVNENLGGYFLASQQFALFFKKQGHGNIVTISSIYGVIAPRFEIYADTQMTMPVEYAAIKSAIEHLTRYFAQYLKGTGIRLNTLSPGGILAGQPTNFLAAYKQHCASKGLLDANDLVGGLIFLLSDESIFMNGQNLIVDDGFSL